MFSFPNEVIASFISFFISTLVPFASSPPCPLAPSPLHPLAPTPPRPLAPSKTICTRGSCLPSLLCCNLLDAVRCWRSHRAAWRGATMPGRGATVPGRGATQLRGKEPQRRGKESQRRGVENRKNHYHLSPKNPGRLALPTVLLRCLLCLQDRSTLTITTFAWRWFWTPCCHAFKVKCLFSCLVQLQQINESFTFNFCSFLSFLWLRFLFEDHVKRVFVLLGS